MALKSNLIHLASFISACQVERHELLHSKKNVEVRGDESPAWHDAVHLPHPDPNPGGWEGGGDSFRGFVLEY